MFDLDLLRDSCVGESEAGVDLGDVLIPVELLFIDEFGEQQRGHALGVGRGHKQRVGVDWIGLAEFFDADAALVDDLALVD